MAHSDAFAREYSQTDNGALSVARLANMLSTTGALDYARREEQHYYDLAMDALRAAAPRAAMQPALDAFASFLLTRQF